MNLSSFDGGLYGVGGGVYWGFGVSLDKFYSFWDGYEGWVLGGGGLLSLYGEVLVLVSVLFLESISLLSVKLNV